MAICQVWWHYNLSYLSKGHLLLALTHKFIFPCTFSHSFSVLLCGPPCAAMAGWMQTLLLVKSTYTIKGDWLTGPLFFMTHNVWGACRGLETLVCIRGGWYTCRQTENILEVFPSRLSECLNWFKVQITVSNKAGLKSAYISWSPSLLCESKG